MEGVWTIGIQVRSSTFGIGPNHSETEAPCRLPAHVLPCLPEGLSAGDSIGSESQFVLFSLCRKRHEALTLSGLCRSVLARTARPYHGRSLTSGPFLYMASLAWPGSVYRTRFVVPGWV